MSNLLMLMASALVALSFVPDAHASAIIGRPLYLGLDQGLVGYWSFDGNHMFGVHAYDASGHGNRGTLTNGPRLAEGKLGQGMAFDGSDDYVDLTSKSGFSAGSGASWTLAAWAKTDVLNSNYHFIVGYGDATSGTSPHIQLDNSNNWQTSTYGNDLSGPPAVKGRWTHVVGVGSGSTLRLYIDGQQYASTVVTNAPVTTRARIGTDMSASPALYFNGLLDDVRIYNRALSADGIKRLYKIGATAKVGTTISTDSLQKGLVGHWSFDGGTIAGTRAHDISGQNNHGTMTNGPREAIGILGQGLAFDGSDDYVTLPPATENPVSEGTAITISVWFKGDLIQSAVRLHGNDLQYILLGWGTSAPISAISTDGGVSDGVAINGVQDNRWHHVAMTWEKNTTNGFKVYVDGAVSAQKTSGYVNLPNIVGGQQPVLGRYNGGTPGEYTKGSLDDVRIYNRVLSPDEIKRLYKNGATTKVGVASNTDSLARGLVGYWSFDGDTVAGTHVYDQSGQGNRGTMTNGPKLAMGKIGQGLAFDGVDDYVDLTNTDVSSGITYSAWIYLSTMSGNKAIISNKRTMFDIPASGFIRWFPDVDLASVQSDTAISTHRWYHIAVTQDTNGKYIFFTNGVPNGSGTAASIDNGIGVSNIGRYGIGSDRYFPGIIDDVRIYNRVLSLDEIKRLYNMGR